MTTVETAPGRSGALASASRPPTVTISADNQRRLQTFPRPPKDNGIGLHLHLDLRDQFIQESIQHLEEVRATWTMIYAQDELQTERAARACFAAGIMPVVRIGTKIDESVDPVPYVKGLRRAWQSAGWGGSVEPLYVQLMNEPEDEREWKGGQVPPNWAQQFGTLWAEQAPKIVGEGGFVGIQVLLRDGFDRAVDAVAAKGKTAIWEKAFFAHHNYGQNHPPAYPYDPIKQQAEPGKTILQDHNSVLKFLAHAAWMQERIGFVLPVIGGEGGWLPGSEEDHHYPKVEAPLHAQYHKEMYEWLRSGVLSNGEPLPDYLFSITSWIVGSWTFQGQNWWGNALSLTGRLDQTIEAMKSIPEFVRRFSWEESNPEPEDKKTTPTNVNKTDPTTKKETQPKEDEHRTPVTFDWDTRLDTLGVHVDRAGEGARWRLIKAEFRDEQQSDGRHHIDIVALRSDSKPAAGVQFVADWLNRQPQDQPVRGTTDFEGKTNLPMFVNFDPTLKNGAMFATVEGIKADVVRGLGLPFKHHVCYVLTYQEV